MLTRKAKSSQECAESFGGLCVPDVKIVIGNKNTSSWSLRAWLVLAVTGLPFEEIRVPLRRADTPERIRRYSPSGKVPALIVEGETIWDSLAIAEFLGEVQPSLWPGDERLRAIARSISAEMHSGFVDLRTFMPMDFVGRFGPPGKMHSGVARDVQRICKIWQEWLSREQPGGPFLFGEFSIADAMYAPVVSRLVTYAVPVDPVIKGYMDEIMGMSEMRAWGKAAEAELASGGLNDPPLLHKESAEEVRSEPPPKAQPAPPAEPEMPPLPQPPVKTMPEPQAPPTDAAPPEAVVPEAEAPDEQQPPLTTHEPPVPPRPAAQQPESGIRALGTVRAQVDFDAPPPRMGAVSRRRAARAAQAESPPQSDSDTFFFGIDDSEAAAPEPPQNVVAAAGGQSATVETSTASAGQSARRLFKHPVRLSEMGETVVQKTADVTERKDEERRAPNLQELSEDVDLPPVSQQPDAKPSEAALPDAEALDDEERSAPRRPAVKPIGGEIHRRR